MNSIPIQPTSRLAPTLSLGNVELTVGDLDRSLTFYAERLGFSVLANEGGVARLGAGGRSLLVLREVAGARPAPRSSTGLYHFAVLVPSRADLARFVRHVATTGLRLGQGDHLVSEAFYLNDPDGHGIEVYRDRPRDGWTWTGGRVRMVSDPVDLPGLLREAGDEPWAGLPDGATLGHVHLRVADLGATRAFYEGVLGLDVVADDYPGALFVSVRGYHHHFGLNTWQSSAGRPAAEGTARLERVQVVLPRSEDLEGLAGRLEAAGWDFARGERYLEVRDPAGNALSFAAA